VTPTGAGRSAACAERYNGRSLAGLAASIRLSIRFGGMHPQTVVAGQVVGTALVAGLLGWLLLAVLDRRARRPRAAWTSAALLVLAVSLALPLAAVTTTSAAIALIVLHLAVGAVVIPGMA
jgi:hypothetical protein